ncbi:MAG: type II secretion system GspH family protein [Fibromonadaceae bacterium]|jgi:prepilin-type N-terminal cleavage/methylation domain-containing protein|nr:type II secretion system GspH family protein [Fibromonadaceae bacterium]
MKKDSKKGFGLMEVMAAAVVLGLLIVGLTRLQLGNREAILRVRVRDVANNIAQEVIDSIAAYGIDVDDGLRECDNENRDLCKHHDFEGDDGKIKSGVDFRVIVNVEPSSKTTQTLKNNNSMLMPDLGDPEYNFAKNIDVTVKWNFRDSDQSINLSAVVR